MKNCPYFNENREPCENGECDSCQHYKKEHLEPLFKYGDMLVHKQIDRSRIFTVKDVTDDMYRLSTPESIWDNWYTIEYVNNFFTIADMIKE